jgi:hypothetical protein
VPVLFGLGLLAGALLGRAPAAGAHGAAVQTLHVLSPGAGDVLVSYSGKQLDPCQGGSGAAQVGECDDPVDSGVTVTIQAKEHDAEVVDGVTQKYSFVRWSDEACWTTNPCKFVMPSEPVTMVAIFSPAEVHLQISSKLASEITFTAPPGGKPIDCQTSANGGGTATADCSGFFPVGTPITLEVKKGNFTAWHRYCAGTDKTCSFVTAGSAWINAEFDQAKGDNIPQKIDVPVKVQVTGSGTVTSSHSQYTDDALNCPSSCTAAFKFGEPVVFTAASGEVANWGKACSGAPKTCAIAAGTYRSVNVAFAAPPTTTTITTTTTTTAAATTTTATTSAQPVTTTTVKRPPVVQLTKVAFIARGKGGTIAATIDARRAAKGQVLLLQRTKTIARWKLSLAQGRHLVKLRVAQRPRSGSYVVSVRLADRDGNSVVLNRKVAVR